MWVSVCRLKHNMALHCTLKREPQLSYMQWTNSVGSLIQNVYECTSVTKEGVGHTISGVTGVTGILSLYLYHFTVLYLL